MRVLPAGDDAVLLDFGSGEAAEQSALRCARALREARTQQRLPACEVVLCATTILVEATDGHRLDELAVMRAVHRSRHEFRSAASPSDAAAEGVPRPDLTIPTVYAGTDLDEVAASCGVDRERLIRAHRGVLWRVQFMGFAPGFGYLTPHPASPPDDVSLLGDIPRRSQPRPSVPAGSVAIAAGYSAVYPRSSPGGWQLIGRTDITLWDSAARPPAALTAGTTVRFALAGSA